MRVYVAEGRAKRGMGLTQRAACSSPRACALPRGCASCQRAIRTRQEVHRECWIRNLSSRNVHTMGSLRLMLVDQCMHHQVTEAASANCFWQ